MVSQYRLAPAQSKVLIDVSGLKPMREEAQKAFMNALQTLKVLGVAQVSVVTTSQLTKLQIMRIASEAGTMDRMRFI